jgi:hypothetical protein
MLSYFLSFDLYARHIEGNHATLIFQLMAKYPESNLLGVVVTVNMVFQGR